MKKQIKNTLIILIIIVGVIGAWFAKNKDNVLLEIQNDITNGINNEKQIENSVGDSTFDIPTEENNVENGTHDIPDEENDVGDSAVNIPIKEETDVGDGVLDIPAEENSVGDGVLNIPAEENDVGDGAHGIPDEENDVGDGAHGIPDEENGVGDGVLDIPLVEIDVNDSNFDLATPSFEVETLKSYGLPILLDFGASWCAPCKKMHPILEELNSELRGKAIVKYIDIDEYSGATKGFDFRLIPTQYFITKDGEIYKTHTGIISKEDAISILKEMGMEE